MRERSLTSICACAASWVTFTDCTAWEDTAVTQVPQLPAQEPDPTHGPAYPIEQLLRGQNFAIFIQPGEGGPKAARCAGLGCSPPPCCCQVPCQGGGLGPSYLYVLHSTRREYTESKSLSTSRPAAWRL